MAREAVVENKTSMNFKPIANLTRWVVWLQALTAAAALLFIFVSLAEMELLERVIAGEGVTDAEIDANDLRVFGAAVFALTVILAQTVVFFFWIYRARANLPALGISDASWSPGYAVGLWFVPILNWFIPFKITKEIWQASVSVRDQESWRDTLVPVVFSWWWAVHVVSSVASMISARATWRAADTAEAYIDSAMISIYSDLLVILAAVLTLIVVRAIGQAQTMKYGLLNHESSPIIR